MVKEPLFEDSVKQEFIDYAKDHLKDFLPGNKEDIEVNVQEIVKSNDLKLTGLIINEPGKNMSPTIYIDSYVDEFRNGEDIDALIGNIADLYIDCNEPPELKSEVDKITDFDSIKDKLVTKIINTEFSSEYLKGIPHKEFGDLSVICQILLSENRGNTASVTIKDDLLKTWGKDFDEVIAIASENDLKITQPRLVPMQAMITQLMYGEDFKQEGFLPDREEEEIPMFVLGTDDKYNGAKLLNKPELLEQIAEFFGTDFIVLPSSIHESIIIPQTDDLPYDITELGKMVREVNGSEVRPEEVLSDHAYVYNKEQKVLCFEKDGETVNMRFTKESKAKESIKDKLLEGSKKSKTQPVHTNSKEKEACI